MINWLQKRLPPVKAQTQSWQELADAIQTFWEENFDSQIERLRSLMSIFRAGASDQALMLQEAGGPYEKHIVPENIPLAYIVKQRELFQKGTEHPILNAIQRAYPGLVCAWKPLYAKVEDTYGTAFYREEQLDPGWSVYLTSRAKVLVNHTFDQGMSDKITEYVRNLKPLHIVFDGVVFAEQEEPPPATDFNGTPTSGYAPLTVSFTDASTGTNTSWAWDFGDGSNGAEQNPSHTYHTPDSYTVSLTASGPGGSDTATKAAYITVTEPPPIVTWNPSDKNATLVLSDGNLTMNLNVSWVVAWQCIARPDMPYLTTV